MTQSSSNHESDLPQEPIGEEIPEQDAGLSGDDLELSQNDAHAEALALAEAKLAEMKDQLLRAIAETENVRRRAQRDVEEASKYAVSGFARDIIGVAENLYMAMSSIPEESRQAEGVLKALADGLDMTLRELNSQFERHGIVRVNPLGDKFDHNLHQAISQVEDPAKEPGTVLQVVQAGYTLQGRLLRPAMVVVTKRGDAEPKLDTKA